MLRKVYIVEDVEVYVEMPASEMCIHMRIVGRIMPIKLTDGPVPMVQVHEVMPDGSLRPFSSPITYGEAGVFTDHNGRPYVWQDVNKDGCMTLPSGECVSDGYCLHVPGAVPGWFTRKEVRC